MSRRYEVIIIGAGPAGSAAAITLARRDGTLAKRSLLLDAAKFPRDKLCGGGLVPQSERLLELLGVSVDVPSVSICEIEFEYEGGRRTLRRPHVFRVVHREEFDHALVQAAAERGIRVHEGETVLKVTRENGALRVVTTRATYRAEVVIGADGACSRVRRALVGPTRGERFVALEVLTPGYEGDGTPAAVFDFRPAARGLRGYAWHFPVLRGGTPWTNRGVVGSRWPADSSLRDLFADLLDVRGVSLARHELQGWSAPLYDAESPQGAERVLLAGDAVGIDPWLGEGISVALGTGILAAHAATDGLGAGRLDFTDHAERVRESAVGWMLGRQRTFAEPFYAAAARPHGLSHFLSQEATP
jgi:geranylgeranyl reductase family protein